MKRQITTQQPAQLRWEDLSPGQRVAVIVTAIAELVLAITAWVNLARRPSARVRGPKALWAAIIAINGIGPVAYFTVGRRRE